MRRGLLVLVAVPLLWSSMARPSAAAEASGFRGRMWIQPAFGMVTGNDAVTSEVPADVRMTGIPLVGSIDVTVPVMAEIEFENPVGLVFGGELVYKRIGVEISATYVRQAALARGGLEVRGGLLTEQEWQLLDTLGFDLPDFIVTEEEIEYFAASLGVNYHFIDHGRWDAWVGPMVVWSSWGDYDLSDARIKLRQSMDDLLQGNTGEFGLSSNPSMAPEDALTFGASAGVSFEFAGIWNAVGTARYYFGDTVELPDSSGDYSVLSFSVGLGVGFGG